MHANSSIDVDQITLTRDRLNTLPRRCLRASRNITKATVNLIDLGSGAIVVKDLAGRPWPIRALLGPWQLDREERAYRRLAGTPGIPQMLGRPDRLSIAMEFIPGRTLDKIRPGELADSFFDRLEELLNTIHRKGIAHGDLHHRDVIEGPEGIPYLVDFATSIAAGPDSDPARRFLFDQMRRADQHALAKLRRRLSPGSAGRIPPRPLLYRIGGRIKKGIAFAPRGKSTHDH